LSHTLFQKVCLEEGDLVAYGLLRVLAKVDVEMPDGIMPDLAQFLESIDGPLGAADGNEFATG
jgi:hypothetical protein